ncbi:hypothetical protein [Mycoplasma seminis]|uniref:Uncharacterized protein n=1 Tax=Mycoplasma seminis TaxID=512749 RepID=A0ABY9HAV9_9MOLU|nr:hypothetical protein [Mycoplasma seminis]WLP85396.1 hypothetical protein Q8852_03685 [Mycoplasma seminis]
MNITINNEYKKESENLQLNCTERINEIINNSEYIEVFMTWINGLNDWEKNKLLYLYDLADDVNKNNMFKSSALYKSIEAKLEFGRIKSLDKTINNKEKDEIFKLNSIQDAVSNQLKKLSNWHKAEADRLAHKSYVEGLSGNTVGLLTQVGTGFASKYDSDKVTKNKEIFSELNDFACGISKYLKVLSDNFQDYPNKEKYTTFDESISQFKYLNNMKEAIENLLIIVEKIKERYPKRYKEYNVESFKEQLELVKKIIEKEKSWLYNYSDSFIPKYASY